MLTKVFVLATFPLFLVFSFFKVKKKKRKIYIILVGGVAVIVCALLVVWVLSGSPETIFALSWYSSGGASFTFSFALDFYSLVFFGVGLYVTWSIIEFAHYYMVHDANSFRFIATLILFLFFMLILVCANRLFLLFVGWEGVGILSFILIRWWFTRREANRSALQAVIYNRIGDRGILLILGVTALFLNSWDFYEVLFYAPPNLYGLFAVGVIVAATGKSAQFSLHPWLPAAMEGPTPVSALLHRSTMVVAGVFLLIRSCPILQNTEWALTLVGLLGSITALFAARVALGQNDFKKVVAYSTTRQLGLMVVAIRLRLPLLAFFHICTHAFFKALLFLCSGRVIHSYNNEQDLRKMGTAGSYSPFTSAAVIVASLALCGLPFLAGFYSKDLILEAAQTKTANLFSSLLAFVATLFTSIYTLRTVFFISYPFASNISLIPLKEEKKKLNYAILRLLLGALVSGWFFSLYLFNTAPFLLPINLKRLPLYLLFAAAALLLAKKINIAQPNLVKFLGLKWFFVQISHSLAPLFIQIVSLKNVLRLLDQGWLISASKGITVLSTLRMVYIQKALGGHLTQYIGASLILTASLGATLRTI